MDLHNGGGQGLQARSAAAKPDNFQQRFGEEIYDEADDFDYEEEPESELDEEMSRMTIDDDELSFATQSVVGRSVGNRSKAKSVSGVSFKSNFGRPRSSSSIAGTVKPPAAGPSILRSSTPSGSKEERKQKLLSGGCFVEYIVDRWMDDFPRKRYSLQCHIKSTDYPELVSVRVSTDQRHVILTSVMSTAITDPIEMAKEYLAPRMKEAYPDLQLDTWAKVQPLIKNHPLHIARVKSISRLKKRDPTLQSITSEIRIPLGAKVSFDWVTKEEDPVCYGLERIGYNTGGELHIFVELKEEKTDGYRSPEPVFKPPVGNMSPIPEHVSFRGESVCSYEMMSVNDQDDEESFLEHLGEVEVEMNRDIAAGRRAVDVSTVYSGASTTKSSPRKKPKNAPRVHTFKASDNGSVSSAPIVAGGTRAAKAKRKAGKKNDDRTL